MLSGLAVRDIVLIEQLDLEFGDGLTVLTGETGAGKSILLDALGLALGRRVPAGMVRPGAAQAVVSATFDLPAKHPARALLAEQGLAESAAGGDQVLLRRTLAADGKSRAFVNDQPISVGLLRALGESLVEIHGQGDEQGLLNAATHRNLLDEFAGLGPQVAGVSAAFRAMREAALHVEQTEARLARARAEQDYLRHVTGELADLAPRAGEEAELAEARLLLRQGEKLAGALQEAQTAFSEGGIASRLRLALRALERVASSAPARLDPVTAALERALSDAQEAEAVLESTARALDLRPERLEQIEVRLFALRAAARKHNVAVDDLAPLAAKLGDQLAAIERGDADLAKLRGLRDSARADYVRAAEALSAARGKAGEKLAKAVNKELAPLKLGGARFEVSCERLDEANWAEHGFDRVSFLVATLAGHAAGPIGKIASGGELSRFMLALKVVLAGVGDAGTLIFDEVDRGVGGATADAVGERLAKLSGNVQVLVVTHSPQVAARGRHHWRIAKAEKAAPRSGKRNGGAGVVTMVAERLSPQARKEEIARMLAGAEITLEARAAAASLLGHGQS